MRRPAEGVVGQVERTQAVEASESDAEAIEPVIHPVDRRRVMARLGGVGMATRDILCAIDYAGIGTRI